MAGITTGDSDSDITYFLLTFRPDVLLHRHRVITKWMTTSPVPLISVKADVDVVSLVAVQDSEDLDALFTGRDANDPGSLIPAELQQTCLENGRQLMEYREVTINKEYIVFKAYDRKADNQGDFSYTLGLTLLKKLTKPLKAQRLQLLMGKPCDLHGVLK